MAFSLCWMVTRRVVFIVVVLSLSSSLRGGGGGVVWATTGVVPGVAVSVNCGVCEKSRCPELHYCEGQAVMDRCGCCQVCSSSKYQPHPLNGDDVGVDDDNGQGEGNACAKVKCPKFKVCVENMQGLPLCTCPSPFICSRRSRRSRQKVVCGTDGVTYASRCHMRIAACNAASRIKVSRRGGCTGAEAARPRACDSLKSCHRRRKNHSPVCGNDGRSYQSRCQMKVAACQRGVKVKVRNHGRCPGFSSGEPAVVSSPGRGGAGSVGAPSTAVPARHSDDDDDDYHHQQSSSDSDVSRGRKDRRRRKKKQGGSEVSGNKEGGRRNRQKQNWRKKRRQRRRKRRKTRGGQHRQRRYKSSKDRRHVLRNIGHSNWK